MDKFTFNIYHNDNVYYHDEFEDINFLPEYTEEEVKDILNRINKCPKCGGDIELHQYSIMGDSEYSISCKKCKHSLMRSQYDYDVKKYEDILDFCIRDWNLGLNNDNIKEKNDQEHERLKIKENDVKWIKYHTNNLIQNPIDGEYCLLFSIKNDKIYCIKWTIQYQFKEKSPLFVNKEIESYNLFLQNYTDFEGPLSYPEPAENSMNFSKENFTLNSYDINNPGRFIRNYKTLEEAKIGALARCGSYGINTDTILKNIEGKNSKDIIKNAK